MPVTSTVTTCPSWCRRSAGHDLDRDRDGVARRVHLGVRTAGLELERLDTVTAAGQVTVGEVRVVSDLGLVPEPHRFVQALTGQVA